MAFPRESMERRKRQIFEMEQVGFVILRERERGGGENLQDITTK